MSEKGIVIRSTGSWYDVRDEEGHVWQARLKGKFKLKGLKTSNPLAVGDRVRMDIENENENTAIINEIEDRDNYIARASVHKTSQAHLLAANVDQAVLIVTLDFPRTSLGFIDRFLVSAESFRIPVLIVFNKQDIFDEEGRDQHQPIMDMYANLGYGTLRTSALTGEGIEELKALLKDKVSLISGHSGVGKSTLVNTIAPDLDLRTSEVSTFANKGVHTTTFAEMFELESGTYLIDTPGIKELGLIDMAPSEISHYFPEMRELLNECKYHNCLHVNEPACAVRDAVEAETIALSRYHSYLGMLQGDDNRR
ncbi:MULTISPECIES: ribosome small subunit-dependent GTPase A [unclassified Siphonobacter]|uniref:ribosome small subunit-dependent GTPase A n=1 Tax=unclassified Siphonobacter TaxID=2635712 RepID=UPI000CBDCF8F|nr:MULTISPECIES: ribosome small subunit-dependent GTPase A [unclassified Siphonobacter]MDQ1088410.1 ribosome biogenesis GTPase [Siphonobacter sp. SORGH_AS_1065]PKK37828.1 ribosome small subunit-dependent GTPase A [Siphonobacter sp. SORGH_AS_0500]